MNNSSITERFENLIIQQYEILKDSEDEASKDILQTNTNPELELELLHRGKVRDSYKLDDNKLLMIASNRLSAFDRSICYIPFKGQLLNKLSAWWFEQTKHIIKNHCINIPSASAMICEKANVIPVEVVVRAYLTGSTQTSIWKRYQQGQREFFGHKTSDNLTKNSKLKSPIIDPTNKSDVHDEEISISQINQNPQIQPYWQQISEIAQKLFALGQKVANNAGLILVDTKYEFGVDKNGQLMLIDECHTSDSSRYWDLHSWQQNQLQPKAYDKELMRLWITKHCDPYTINKIPEIPIDLIVLLSSQYISLYEKITQEQFVPELK